MNRRVLISGGGIAGLALGLFLRRTGWEPLVIERDPAVRQEGYIVDVFGTGWDMAGRLGILDRLKAVTYPFNHLAYVRENGEPFVSIGIDRIKQAFHDRYLTLRRTDLEAALFEKTQTEGLEVRFDTCLRSLQDTGPAVEVAFENGDKDSFSLVFGADGVHSRTRQLVFGEEREFARFLGTSVAAFHAPNRYGLTDAITMYETADRFVAVYPISEKVITAIYLFRNRSAAYVPPEERLTVLRRAFEKAGWLCRTILDNLDTTTPIFLDSFTQIVMPSWRKGRCALLGDACGALTMVSGQGSHMAMGEAYLLSRALEHHAGAETRAFQEYEDFFKPVVRQKQARAALLLKIFIPSAHTPPSLRRIGTRLLFGTPLVGLMPRYFGAKSVLEGR